MKKVRDILWIGLGEVGVMAFQLALEGARSDGLITDDMYNDIINDTADITRVLSNGDGVLREDVNFPGNFQIVKVDQYAVTQEGEDNGSRTTQG